MKNSSNDKSLQYWGLLSFWKQRFSTFDNLGFKPQAIEKYTRLHQCFTRHVNLKIKQPL
jgi:hypothetical protein